MVIFHESIRRSVLKSISFRILVIISDLLVIFFITHRYDVTIGLTVATNLASTILYYFHERIWNAIHFGKKSVKKKDKPANMNY